MVITYEGKHNHDLPSLKDGGDPPATALLTAATTAMTNYEQTQEDDPPSYETPTARLLPDVDGKIINERARELGGEKAIESAQTLLSIGLNSTSENVGGKNCEGIQQPRLNGNRTLPVQNSMNRQVH